LRSLTNQEEVIKGHLKSEQEAFSDPKVEFEAQIKYKQMLQSVSGVDKTLGSVFKFFNCSLSISAEDRLQIYKSKTVRNLEEEVALVRTYKK